MKSAIWSTDKDSLHQCKAWLDDNNHAYELVYGMYKGNREISFATTEDTLLEAINAGWLYNQESVILADMNTATLYWVPGDIIPSEPTLIREKSGAWYWSTHSNGEDYTYSAKRMQYMLIHWYH